jgi:acetyl esterase/lipase
MLALDGHRLAAQGHRREELAGWIGLAGPYNFVPIRAVEVQPVFHHPQVPADSQPIVHAAQRAAPSFLGAASTDAVVNPVRNTQALAAALRAAGTPVTLRLYDRTDHVSLLGIWRPRCAGWRRSWTTCRHS